MIDVLVAEMMDETLRTMIDTTQHVLAEMIDEMQHMVDEKVEMISATWRKAIAMMVATWTPDTEMRNVENGDVIMETDIETIDEGCERVKAITSAAAEKQRPQDDICQRAS